MCAVPNLPPELRRVPPESFVATRDALSRRLREAGDREAAAEVRRLRRPPPPLWALNQLAAVEPDGVQALIRAGEALRDSTQKALQGGRGALGRLSSEHAHLVEQLTGRAMEVLAGVAAPATSETRARIWTMLRVASLDPALAPCLADGSLAEEPVSTGFDSLLGFDPGPAPAKVEAAAPPPQAASETGGPARTRQRREQAEDLRSAIARARAARAETEHRRERLAKARRRAADLRAQVEAAEREAEQAHREVAAAEESAEALEAEVERLRSEQGN